MDMIFFLTGCLGLAETIDLFCDKDFLIFITDSIDPADYNIKKVYSVEKWLFAIDTIAMFAISFRVGGMNGILIMMAVIFATLFAHWHVFKSPKYRNEGRTGNRRRRKDK